jgi:hypothetical protein
MNAREVRDELLRLETALALRDPEGIEGGLMSLIAPDFFEFGSSGRVWDARNVHEVLEVPRGDPVSIEQFVVSHLGDSAVLATYRTVGPRPASRSSIWVHREGRWLIRFHQGTPRRARAESADSDAADQLIETAAEQGDLATLGRLAQQGNKTAAEVLEELTAE